VTAILPRRRRPRTFKAAAAALDAMRKQGVTTFLDCHGDPETLAAFAVLSGKAG